MHGAGDVYDEDVFPARYLGALHLLRGLQHAEEEILLFALIQEKSRLYLVPGKAPAQYIVLVAARLLRPVEGHLRVRGTVESGIDLVEVEANSLMGIPPAMLTVMSKVYVGFSPSWR